MTHQHPNVDWAKERDNFRKKLLKQITKAGYHDIEPRIRYERVITPADWDTRYEIYRGATFNLAHTLDQMLHLRPRNRFEDLDGVYLVGGGTHPGSGLPVIFESARISSRLLLEDFGVSHPGAQIPVRRTEKIESTERRGVTAEAVQLFARMFNLKPAPIVTKGENSHRPS